MRIRQALDATKHELSASWPDAHFRDVLDRLLVKSGVVAKNPNRATNPTRRLAKDQGNLAMFLKAMLAMWLRLWAVFKLDVLKSKTYELAQRAQTIQRAAINSVRVQLPEVPVAIGALSIADVMLAGFTHAAKIFPVVLEAAHGVEEGKQSDLANPVLEWGAKVAELFAWAKRAKSPKKPKGPHVPKKSANVDKKQEEPSPQSAEYFAVAHGRVPGVYRSRADVRAQTRGLETSGRMKICVTFEAPSVA